MRVPLPTAAVCVSLVFAGAAVASSGGSSAAAARGQPAADPAGSELIDRYCTSCHSADQVTARSRTAEEWAETIDKMVDYGAQITPADRKQLTAFLVAHHGKK